MPYAVDSPPAIVSPAPDLSGYAKKGDLPGAATAAPPATDVGGAAGASPLYARADHTHATSVQRARLTISAAGIAARWTFAKPYDAGTVPVVTCTAQNAAGAGLPFVVNTQGNPTNTYADIIVFRTQTQTLGGTLLAISGVTISLFAPAPAGTIANCQAAKATQ